MWQFAAIWFDYNQFWGMTSWRNGREFSHQDGRWQGGNNWWYVIDGLTHMMPTLFATCHQQHAHDSCINAHVNSLRSGNVLVNRAIIGSGNGLALNQRLAITWTNVDLLQIGPWEEIPIRLKLKLEYGYQNDVCWMSAILVMPQCVK